MDVSFGESQGNALGIESTRPSSPFTALKENLFRGSVTVLNGEGRVKRFVMHHVKLVTTQDKKGKDVLQI